MINVLHIVFGLQVGGLEKFVLDLAANCSPGIRTVIACLEHKGELGEKFAEYEIIALHKKPGIRLAIVRQLMHVITAYGIDLIHTHNSGPHFYGALAGFLTRRPIIHTKHGRNEPVNRRKVLLNRFSSFLTRRVIAVSRNAAEVCTEVERVPPAKVSVIHNGVDISLFDRGDGFGAVPGQPVQLGVVARLAPEKDHLTLLRACTVLKNRGVPYHLLIVGDGPLRSDLEQQACDMGLAGHVAFSGVSHDIAALLRQFDIFVLSSLTEGISLTLLEAGATALPIVATAVGGTPEVVVDGVTGFLVPPQQPEVLADRLMHLIQDLQLRVTLGANGRKRVVDQFDIRRTAACYEQVYHEILTVARP